MIQNRSKMKMAEKCGNVIFCEHSLRINPPNCTCTYSTTIKFSCIANNRLVSALMNSFTRLYPTIIRKEIEFNSAIRNCRNDHAAKKVLRLLLKYVCLPYLIRN